MIRVGDRVRHRDVIGATGRVVRIELDFALVRWTGYPIAATWTPVVNLVAVDR